MAQTTQIYTLEDLYAQRFAPLSTLDLSRVSATVQAYAEFLANDMAEQLNDFTEEITASRSIWGGAPAMAFDEVNEFGRGVPRKQTEGQELHFPLFKLSATQGASDEFWKRANIKDLIDTMNSMQIGYAAKVRDEVKAAIFNPLLHTKVKDWLVDNSTLDKIQPFLNKDGASIPTAPNGSTFTSSTHGHYLGISGSVVSANDVNTLLGHVREHVVGKVVLYVDGAMPATLASLTSGTHWVGLTPVVTVNQSAAEVARASFDPAADRNNMLVGYWDGHEVRTRSWVPTNYMVALAIDGSLGKPLFRRVDPQFPGLRGGFQVKDGRVTIEEMYFYMGFGVFNRAAGAVLDCATGSNSYTTPSGLVRA